MFLSMKKRIFDLMETVSEMLEVLSKLSDPFTAIDDCLMAIQAIYSQLELEENVPYQTINQLQQIQKSLTHFYQQKSSVNEAAVKELNCKVADLQSIFWEEVKPKLKVAFFPYKASMWDSLESIYEATLKDENCVSHVIPIPYYQLTQTEFIPTYEGDRFPSHVPVLDYSTYNLQEQEPDIIFVHNIYDQYNTLTRVYEQYYTSNLKKYTSMLVYVPYHVSTFVVPKKGDQRAAYSLSSIQNVDKVILAGDFLKEAAMRDGIPENKLLALGSPKFDAMLKVINEGTPYPSEWNEKVEGKTVYLLNTGCLHFVNNPLVQLERLIDFLNIPRINEDSVLIWRPHPLTRISIKKYVPAFLEYYVQLIDKIKSNDSLYSGVIIDESDDYFPALKRADVLISNSGSLLRSYLLTEKKVLYWGEKMPEGSLIPQDAFYYAYNRDEPWFKLVKKFAEGYDPLEKNRKGLAAKAYKNTDGTSGEKIYQAISNLVLQNHYKNKVH